jgi:hypothetical protein
MISAALAGLLSRQPYQPLAFVLAADNNEVHVSRAPQVHHEPGNRIVTVTSSEGREYIIDLDRIAMIEDSPPKAR